MLRVINKKSDVNSLKKSYEFETSFSLNDRLGNMTDPLSVMRLRELLKRSEQVRDTEWCRDTCTAERFVHIDVWTRSLPKKYVKDVVVPLLSKAETQLLEYQNKCTTTDDKKEVEVFFSNCARRSKNIIKNYLQNKPSAFTPEDKISGLKKKQA